jgi:hypothetical protein
MTEVNSDDSNSSTGGEVNALAKSSNLTGSEQYFSTDHAPNHYVRRDTSTLGRVSKRVSDFNKSSFLMILGVIGQESAPSASL